MLRKFDAEDVVRPDSLPHLPLTRPTDRNVPLVGTPQRLCCHWRFRQNLLGRHKPKLVAETAPPNGDEYLTEKERMLQLAAAIASVFFRPVHPTASNAERLSAAT